MRPTFLDIRSFPIEILDKIDREIQPRGYQLLDTSVVKKCDRYL